MAWPPIAIEDVVRFLGDRRTVYVGGVERPYAPPWDMEPETYVAYARTDVRGGGARGRVNALSNAKRALHGQVDAILYCSGLSEIAGHWRFPKRLKTIGEMGIATAGVLQRINGHRNEVEHEYVAPLEADRLNDLVDVVGLFVGATRRFARRRFEPEFAGPFRAGERGIDLRYDGDDVAIGSYPGGKSFRVGPRDPDRRAIVVATYAALARTREA